MFQDQVNGSLTKGGPPELTNSFSLFFQWVKGGIWTQGFSTLGFNYYH
uniref:Uncharacterized protein n=1 Tax=Rhizophora mucronata TaxID=61149 RepID=A0A2P2N7U9_RHIMU